jgi:hypothetical protein
MWFPKGVLSRPPASFFQDQVASVYFNSPAVGGALSYVRLANNDDQGRNLYIVSLHYSSLGYIGLFIEWGNGSEGSAAVNQPLPLDPQATKLPGKVFNFSAATCVQTPTSVVAPNNTGLNFSFDHPLQIVRPGNSLYLHGDSVGTRILGSIWYMVKRP